MIYAGGYTDYLSQRGGPPVRAEKAPPKKSAKPAEAREKTAPKKLSFKQPHRLDALPSEMER